MTAFSVAAELLGKIELSSAQLAQLRALDREYHQRLFALLQRPLREPDGAPDAPAEAPSGVSITAAEAAELRAMLERGIREAVDRSP